MSIDHTTVAARVDHFLDICRQAGIKITHQRTEVFRELARTDEHPDAETVHQRVRKRVPAVSLDTVYRTLHLLEDKGIITRIGGLKDPARFDANSRPHHHFLCTACGLMLDFYSPAYDRVAPPVEVNEMGTVESIRVEIRGLCSQCRMTRKD